MSFVDVRRAHFHAPATRDVYVMLPSEDNPTGDPNIVGKLRMSLYGTRDASANWEKAYGDHLVANGFVVGIASPGLFYNAEHDVRIYVHGDDFITLADEEGQAWYKAVMEKIFVLKWRGCLGDEENDSNHIRILNRYMAVKVASDGRWWVEWEADPRHADLLIDELGLSGCKPATTPGQKQDSTTLNDEEILLGGSDITAYRSLVMRGCYLAQDRPDIAYACKECARHMQNPNTRNWEMIKRVGRYLAGHRRLVQCFYPQDLPTGLHVNTDSDHAGCKLTRKSTTGAALMHGEHCVKFMSSTQSNLSLSSGESEFYAILKGASLGLGMKSFVEDFGIKLDTLRIRTDSSAAKAMNERRGLGTVRHLESRHLWLQQRVHQGLVCIGKEKGTENVADLGTKYVPADTLQKLLKKLGFKTINSTHSSAVKLIR